MSLKNYAVSARFDYHPTEKLRFVAALRDEKYNKPDKWQPSFQFTGSYKINDNNIIRAVYSRANQSTFMINAFSNYTWNLEGTSSSVDAVHFGGSAKPSMMIQDMFEIGYRTRPAKNLLIDIEAFYNKSKDFSALMPDSMRTNVGANLSTYTTLYTSYRDLDIKSEQYGISLSADMVLSEKLLLKAHFTYQQSKVTDLLDLSRNQVAGLQGAQYQPALTNDITNYYLYITGQGPYADAPNASYSSGYQPGESYYKDMDNEAVPSFWGSLSFTYKPTNKLDITAQGYYYDKYYLYSQYETSTNRPADPKYTGHIDGKFSLNAKVNYKINEMISVFVNARNVLNNDTQEYVFMDKIGGLYLAGFNFKL